MTARGHSYSGYDVSYAPRGQTWFVLSGEDNNNVFYEKVTRTPAKGLSAGAKILAETKRSSSVRR